MADDIVARLRCAEDMNDAVYHPWVYKDAADRIEQLEAALREVISVSDRKTDIYDRAKAVLAEEKRPMTDDIVARLRAEIARKDAALRRYACECDPADICIWAIIEDHDHFECGHVACVALAGE